MQINTSTNLDVTIHHAAGTSLADAHAAAKTVKGVRIIDTFRTWNGSVISRGIAGRAWSEIVA